MPLSIRPLHRVFAGEVTGVDCRRPLGRGEVAAIEAGMDEYAVLVFPEQELSDAEQIAFTRHFGELERNSRAGHIRKNEDHRLGPGIADFSNLDKSGALMSAEDRVWFFKLADRLWHSDSSFRPVPAKYSLLSGRVVPSWGANTEFADMRAAYDALPEAMKAAIAPLVAEHDIFWSRGQIGFSEFAPGEREKYPPSRQRLVRRHPGSGRKTVYLSAHASHIVGWPVADGRILLYDLNLHATRPEFVYSHQWGVGDLVIWDNRSTMHRGRPHDESQPRDLRRATTLDVGSTLEEAA